MITHEPPAGVPYQHLLRREPMPVAAFKVLVLGVVAFLATSVVAQLVLALTWALGGARGSWSEHVRAGLAFERPDGMLAAHLGLAALVPLSILALRFGGGLRSAWAHSVQPGFRWRYPLVVAAASTLVLAIALVAGQRLPTGGLHPQPGFWWFLVVIVLTSPMQAAGEEYLFRGVLLTGLGGLFRSPWVGIVASAAIFALLHGVQSVPLFLDRFAFGLLAAVLVWQTGGLEAGVAIHAVNNVLAFTSAGLVGTIAEVRAVRDVTWWQAGVDVATFAVAAGLAWWLGRRFRLATTTPDDTDGIRFAKVADVG